jgi:C_GCAxxG_C_C family probable redox protein
MKTGKNPGEKAVDYFTAGYNCSRSVLLALFEHWYGKNELVPKIATAFGGGIGMCGSICGAVSGGVMAIGIRYGTNEPKTEKREKAYKVARKFFQKFEQCHGSVLCRELIGYDLFLPKELKKARESKTFERKCTAFVRDAVERIIELDELQDNIQT